MCGTIMTAHSNTILSKSGVRSPAHEEALPFWSCWRPHPHRRWLVGVVGRLICWRSICGRRRICMWCWAHRSALVRSMKPFTALRQHNCRYCSEQHASLSLIPSLARSVKDGCAAWSGMKHRLSAALDLCLDCHLAEANLLNAQMSLLPTCSPGDAGKSGSSCTV
jgi:hypothetical protein